MTMLFDIGIGIILALLSSKLFSLNANFSLIFLGVVFVLLPDIDFLVELIGHRSVGGKEIREHRELTHYPLTYVLPAVIIWILFEDALVFLFISGIFAHFLHDSVGIGWGIKWFWPLSRKNYKLFSEKDGSFSSRFIVSWSPDELRNTVSEHGDPNWIRNIYFTLHPINVIEFFGFILSLVVLYFCIN